MYFFGFVRKMHFCFLAANVFFSFGEKMRFYNFGGKCVFCGFGGKMHILCFRRKCVFTILVENYKFLNLDINFC